MATAEETMWWYRALHARLIHIVDALDLPCGAHVLDAGCGTGGFLYRLNRARPDLQLVGLELNPVATAIAHEKTRLDIVRGTVDLMPFGSDRFDAIVSADVLYHRQVDELAALGEFRRCLKRGGNLVLHLAAYDWMTSTHDVRVHTARRYTATRVRRLFVASGFKAVEVGYRNSVLFPLMAAWRLTKGRHEDASDTHAYPQWQENVLFALVSAENVLANRGLRFPFGGSVVARGLKA